MAQHGTTGPARSGSLPVAACPDPWDSISVSIRHADLYPCTPDWEIAPTLLEHDGLFYVWKQACWVEYDGARYEGRPGDLFLSRWGRRFAAGHDPVRPVTVLSTGFRLYAPGQADAWRHLPLPCRLRLGPRHRREVEAAFQVLLSDLQEGTSPGRLAAQGALLRLVALVLRLAAELPEAGKAGTSVPVPGEASRISAVLNFIDRNLAAPLALRDLARAAHLSPVYFTTLFRRETGQPPMVYLRRRRVEAARALLSQSDRTVEQIAGAVGFPDPFHFSRAFRRVVGVSPSAYRASLKSPFSG